VPSPNRKDRIMRPKWTLAVFAVVIVAVGVASRNVLATPASGVVTTQLGKATFGDLDLRAHSHLAGLWRARVKTRGASDVYVIDNKIAVNGTTGWHSHPGPSLIEVIHGSVTDYESHGNGQCPPQVYAAGSGFVDPGGDDVHMLRNEGTEPAETIAVQLLPQGADRRIDALTAPQGCPA